jgi:hypothetical protein
MGYPQRMSDSEPETGRHAAPDDDPNSDPPPLAGEGGDHRAGGAAENVEVDNTQRDFDVEKGMFEDSEGFEEAKERFPPLGGQGA